MARVLRGDILWANLDPTRGHEQSGLRPVLILSHEEFNQSSSTVIALAITSRSQRAGFPLSLEIKSVKLPKQSWVKIGQVRTLAVERLGKKLGHISREELRSVIDGLIEIVGD